MAKKLYGTDPDQVPTNADLGTMAYQDSDSAVLADPLFQHEDSRQAKFKRVDGQWSTIEINAGNVSGNSRIAFTDPDTEDQTAQNTADGMIDYEHSADALRFYTDQSLAAQFTSSGNLLFPDGQGIDFSSSEGSGASASILDDYEEGTWTPSYRNGDTEMTYTMGNERAEYRKIGDTVWIHLGFRFTALSGTGTSAFRIYGLPFTTKSNGAYQEYRFSCALGNNVNTANSDRVFGFGSNGNSYLEFRIMNGGDTVFRSNEMDGNSFMSVWGFYVVA